MSAEPEFPYLAKLGLGIVASPRPHVPWRDLRRKLGQWRYGFALRWGRSVAPKLGPAPEDAERVIRSMAKECGKTWPGWWRLEG